MGNKIYKIHKTKKQHKQIENSKYLCQSCEETKLRLEFQNNYWGIMTANTELTCWENNKTCENYECKRYKK